MNRLIENMPNAEYHAHTAISKSGLDKLHQSPAHYQWYRDHGSTDSDALRFGSAFHTFLLEPEHFDARVAISPELDKRTKAGKEEWQAFVTGNLSKTIITEADKHLMVDMAKAIRSHTAAAIVLEGKGKIEPSLFWRDEETGVECRARPDWLRDDGVIVDLKTARCAKPEDFMRHAYGYRYHVQAAFYMAAYKAVTGKEPQGFMFVAVEKEPPHGVSVFIADEDFLRMGRIEYRDDLDRYAQCLKQELWPGYPDELIPLAPPAWVLKQQQQYGV